MLAIDPVIWLIIVNVEFLVLKAPTGLSKYSLGLLYCTLEIYLLINLIIIVNVEFLVLKAPTGLSKYSLGLLYCTLEIYLLINLLWIADPYRKVKRNLMPI